MNTVSRDADTAPSANVLDRPGAEDPALAALRMITQTRSIRYLHISLWGLCLATVVPLPVAAFWYALTMAAGYARSLVEERIRARLDSKQISSQRPYALIAMASCAFWAAAPVLAWQSAHPFGQAAAMFLVLGGFMLALSQFRSTPANALIVTAPYSAVFFWFILDSFGSPGFWPMLAGVPVLVATIGYMLIFGYMLQQDMQRNMTERSRLIEELSASRIAAERASEAKSMFLANMSHEIRTPMNGVLGMAELLAQTRLDTRQRLYAETIHKSGAALLTIINDILDFSKIEAGKLELDLAPFDLRAAVEDVAALVAPRAQEKRLEVVVRFQPGLASQVVGDGGRIRQIITNLAGNAVKFTEAGYVLIAVSGAETAGRAHIRIEVSDTGVGIEADKLERIFGAFQQADSTTTRQFGGTGLGLSISKRLVEAMGGDVGVSSTLGEGSTFWFTLDLPVHASDIAAPPMSFDAIGKRVLIVDDIEVNRQIAAEQLAAWGFETHTASGGEEALGLLRDAADSGSPYELVIVDYFMPVMDGEMLARAIRGEAAIAEAPILVLTSVDQQGDARRFREIGVDGYLVKPARATLLLQTIGQILGKKKAEELEEHPDEAVAPASEPASEGDRIRILLAEDNEVNQLVVRHMLKPALTDLVIVGNGRDAVARVADAGGVFDLILMDVSMPEMDGYEAARAIRALEAERGAARTPIICLTAHVMSQDVELSEAAGMDDFLSKPISQDRLDAVIRRWTAPQEPVAASA
ncbi:MAG: response regulator [Pseudomonadota bacterium]|nr:response regulator [Pseudomonadota bacterium]